MRRRRHNALDFPSSRVVRLRDVEIATALDALRPRWWMGDMERRRLDRIRAVLRDGEAEVVAQAIIRELSKPTLVRGDPDHPETWRHEDGTRMFPNGILAIPDRLWKR